jgi:hypothetical protein
LARDEVHLELLRAGSDHQARSARLQAMGLARGSSSRTMDGDPCVRDRGWLAIHLCSAWPLSTAAVETGPMICTVSRLLAAQVSWRKVLLPPPDCTRFAGSLTSDGRFRVKDPPSNTSSDVGAEALKRAQRLRAHETAVGAANRMVFRCERKPRPCRAGLLT